MLRIIKLCLSVTGIGWFALAADQASGAESVQRFELENGLQVLLRPVSGAKQAAMVVLYSVGGDHDPQGRSGLAHLVEHVYVTAAAGDQPQRTVQEYLRRYPGGWNAQTGDQYTVFATVFTGQQLEAEIQDAAQRMGNLHVEPGDLEREQPRIAEELENMFGRIPPLGARNHARELVRATPLGGRKGGILRDVAKLTATDVQEQWRQYYKPKNAVLVVAGAIEADAARQSIVKHFGPLPPGDIVPRAAAPGAGERGQAHTFVSKPIAARTTSEASLAYRAPDPGGELYPAFLVLVSRLQANASKLGADAGRFPVAFAPLDDGAVISIGVAARPGETAEAVMKRLQSFVEATIKERLMPQDLTAATQIFGPMLGLDELPEQMLKSNPYFVAFSMGRRQQLRIDPLKLKNELAALTDDKLRQAAARLFGAEQGACALISVDRD